MAQMKATDIKNKTSSHSSQNRRGRTLIFLAIYVLETCGPVAPHCARMTNFMKHQKIFSSQCTTSPIFKLISTTVWILWQFEKVPFFAPLGVIFPFSFLLGRGSTPDHSNTFCEVPNDYLFARSLSSSNKCPGPAKKLHKTACSF